MNEFISNAHLVEKQRRDGKLKENIIAGISLVILLIEIMFFFLVL